MDSCLKLTINSDPRMSLYVLFSGHVHLHGCRHKGGGLFTKSLSFARPVRRRGVEVEGICKEMVITVDLTLS